MTATGAGDEPSQYVRAAGLPQPTPRQYDAVREALLGNDYRGVMRDAFLGSLRVDASVPPDEVWFETDRGRTVLEVPEPEPAPFTAADVVERMRELTARLNVDRPRPTTFEMGRAAAGAVMEWARAGGNLRDPSPFDPQSQISAAFGVPVVPKDDMDPDGWRLLDQHGDVMGAGTIGGPEADGWPCPVGQYTPISEEEMRRLIEDRGVHGVVADGATSEARDL